MPRRLLPNALSSAALCCAVLCSACRSAEPAPTALDDLARYLFVEYESDDTERLLEGAVNLAALHDSDGSDAGWSGTLSDLDGEAFAAVGLEPDLDTAWLTGVFELVPHPACTPMELANLYAQADQDVLFPGWYDAYSRTWQSDPDCFFDGTCTDIAWTSHITTTYVLTSGSYDFEARTRRIDHDAGPTVLVRGWLPEPAVIGDGDSAAFFDQSYSIEVFSALEDGSALHFTALWNSGGIDGADPDGEFWERQYIDGIADWSDRIDALCETGW